MCRRLQGQADQKFNCSWSLKYQSLPTMHIERLQSNIEWVYQNMPNRGCNSQTSTSPSTRVHRLHRQYTHTSHEWIPSSAPQDKPQGQRRLQRPLQRWGPSHRGSMGGAHSQRDYRYSTETTCGYCGSWPHRAGEECKAVGQECHHCGRLGHFSKVCRQRSDYQNSEKTAVKHIDMEEQPETTFRVSTPPHISSQMNKPKPQSNA